MLLARFASASATRETRSCSVWSISFAVSAAGYGAYGAVPCESHSLSAAMSDPHADYNSRWDMLLPFFFRAVRTAHAVHPSASIPCVSANLRLTPVRSSSWLSPACTPSCSSSSVGLTRSARRTPTRRRDRFSNALPGSSLRRCAPSGSSRRGSAALRQRTT